MSWRRYLPLICSILLLFIIPGRLSLASEAGAIQGEAAQAGTRFLMLGLPRRIWLPSLNMTGHLTNNEPLGTPGFVRGSRALLQVTPSTTVGPSLESSPPPSSSPPPAPVDNKPTSPPPPVNMLSPSPPPQANSTAPPPPILAGPPSEAKKDSLPVWAAVIIAVTGFFIFIGAAAFVYITTYRRNLRKWSHHDGEPSPNSNIELDNLGSDNDFDPRKLIANANQTYGSVVCYAERVLERIRDRRPDLLHQLLVPLVLPSTVDSQGAAAAFLSRLTSQALLEGFDDADFQIQALRDDLLRSKESQSTYFKNMFETAGDDIQSVRLPTGFKEYREKRAQVLVTAFLSHFKNKPMPFREANEILFHTIRAPDGQDPEFDTAAYDVYLLHAAAFSFKKPAKTRWATEGNVLDEELYHDSSCDSETRNGRSGISVFPALVLSENIMGRGTVYGIP